MAQRRRALRARVSLVVAVAATGPLQPRTYEIRLLLDDGYRSPASSAPFEVVQP